MDTLVNPHLTLSGLGEFPRAAGHRPLWVPLPPHLLPVPVREVALVGQGGSLEWLAVSAGEAPRTARRLSAALAARGRMAVIMVLDRERGVLAVAATVDRTAVLALPLDNPGPGPLARLRRLVQAGPVEGLAFALRAVEALEGEDAGRRFFDAFRATLDSMAVALTGRLAPADRRLLALVQLTRILFLYFVQEKGWLDRRPRFLRESVDDALGRRRRLHRDLFRPLFFGTLNRPLPVRGRSRRLGAIPFLNGGLFEPHPLERAWRGEVPDVCWREAFDGLFERFQFTVRENRDPGRIAPDMLGRVFEGVMAPGDRRAEGAFYTPAAVVGRLVEAALAARVAGRLDLSPAEAAARLAARCPRAVAAVGEMTLLDPAAGSGAFLLGALERMAALRAGELPPATLRRRILERNLFGVDRNPMAVRLAELRLWLAVIAEDGTADPLRVLPLPNLDGVVRQGDSLLDALGPAVRGGTRAPSGAGAAALRAARVAFVAASGPEKSDLLRRLRRAEREMARAWLEENETRLRRRITDCLAGARRTTLFGERTSLDAAGWRELRRLRRELGEARALRRALVREGAVPWFSCECHFGDVLAGGGFDLVIGNPPWVRAEQLPERLRHRLRERFRFWRGGGRGFSHQPDLSLAFVERGLELLAPGGVLAYLLPAKIATAGYARGARAHLADRCTLHHLADLSGDPAAAFDATIYPAALVAARTPPPAAHAVRLGLESSAPAGPAQARLAGGGPWVLAQPDLLEALAELRSAHPLLAERFPPQLGVKTGANEVFLDPPAEIEPSLIRRAVRGRDLRPFAVRGGVRLLFPHDAAGHPFPRLPAQAGRYLESHLDLLRARVDWGGGVPWALFRVAPALAPWRVVWADLARQLAAMPLLAPVHRDLVPLNSCYVLVLPDRLTTLAIAAWLNCTWIRAAARADADVAAGGFARFNARVVGALPLPAAVPADPELARLAERGLAGDPIQEALDDRTAHHLGLGSRARALLAAHDRRRGADRRRRPA